MNFSVKIRDIHKIENKSSISISVFSYENKKKYPIYQSKKCYKEKNPRFMYDHSLHYGRKHPFSTDKLLKYYIKDSFKINGNQTSIMHKKGERKIKPPFMIFADFESILVPKNNGKQTVNDPYTTKYQKHVACIYAYKLVCVDDKFSKTFKSYLGENVDKNH